MRRMIQGVLTLASLTLAHPAMAGQARSSAVTEWGDCGGESRDWWDDMCMAWRHKMGDKGWSQWKANYSAVKVGRYVDPAMEAWGYDNASNGFDQGDAALLCTHGGYDAVGWYGLMHSRSEGECGANVNQLRTGSLAGGKTKQLQLSSCNSLRWSKVNSWFTPAAGGMHSVSGFHGLMYIGWYYVNGYDWVADDAFTGESVSEAWVDVMTDDPIIGPTVCGVSMAFGNDKNAALHRLFHETYKYPTADQSNKYGVLMWVSQCDPDDAGPLPN